jgi:hypothetical protein
MEKINIILGFIGYLIMIPIWILAVVLIVLGIIGLFKKNFVNFKKVLKVWGYFWLGFLLLLIIKFISTFVSNL